MIFVYAKTFHAVLLEFFPLFLVILSMFFMNIYDYYNFIIITITAYYKILRNILYFFKRLIIGRDFVIFECRALLVIASSFRLYTNYFFIIYDNSQAIFIVTMFIYGNISLIIT